MRLKKKNVIIIACLAVIAIILSVYISWENSALVVTEITVSDNKIPQAFDGYRIAHISDLHCSEFGEHNQTLLNMLAGTEPDIIVITGDLIDYRHGDVAVGIDFSRGAAAIAPTYFVTGNHEQDKGEADVICDKLREAGVTVLRGESIELTANSDKITLAGIDDVRILKDKDSKDTSRTILEAHLEKLSPTGNDYAILLAHRPEFVDLYAQCNFNLVFSGHAHGGQFRLPCIGGLYAPGQGIFPEYTEGLHTVSNTELIISRGLGNAGFPFRFNNRPEIVVATLKHE